jgi:chemotaxis protein histidine kinase CheA
MANRQEFIVMFVALAQERLARAEVAATRLATEPSHRESLEHLARELHTLRGESSLVGLDQFARVAKQTEEVFRRARASSDTASWALVLQGLSVCRALHAALPDQPYSPGVDVFEAAVARFLARGDPHAGT